MTRAEDTKGKEQELEAYRSEESGWSVLQLHSDEHGPVTAVGVAAELQTGEELRLFGRWVEDPGFGMHFRP